MTTPANNVAKYVLKVRRTTPNSVITDNYKAIKFGTEDTIRSFPLDLRITPQMIADALQIPVSTLQIGDKYFFYGEAYGFDGTKTTYNNLSATVRIQPGMKQAFRFVTSLETDSNINNFGATYDNYNF